MLSKRLINSNNAGGGCTDIVDNYDPFGGNGLALYQLNGNADDVSGNYNATASNVTYGTGVFGQAGVFNGTSSVITLPSGSPFNDSDTIKTISAWVKLDTPTSRIRGIYAFGSDDLHFFEFRYIGDNNYISVFARNGSSANQVNYQADLPSPQDTNWHHTVTTFDGTNVKIYFDGQDIPITITKTGSATNSSWISYPNYSGTTVGTIGKSRTATYSNGEIDQVRIFNTALTPLEVEALYTEELCICGGTVDTLDILGDGSCIATYQLDANANDLSGDYSGTEVGGLSYGVGEFDLSANFGESTGSNKGIETELNISGSHSISVWANVNLSGEGIYKTIFWSQNDASRVRFFGYNDNVLVFAVFGNQITLPYSSYNNTWVHLVCVINSANSMSLYVDGSLHSTISITETITGTGYYDFGKNRGDASWYAAPGSIDQVRVFNKALNSTEVTTLYNETACTKPVYPDLNYENLDISQATVKDVLYNVDPSQKSEPVSVSSDESHLVWYGNDLSNVMKIGQLYLYPSGNITGYNNSPTYTDLVLSNVSYYLQRYADNGYVFYFSNFNVLTVLYLSIPYDISSYTSFNEYSWGDGLTASFNEDGSMMYLKYGTSYGTNSKIYQYSTSNFVYSRANLVGEFSTNGIFGASFSQRLAVITPDGRKVICVGTGANRLDQLDLSTPFDITTASFNNKTLSLTNLYRDPYDVNFSLDGKTMYIGGSKSLASYNITL